MSKLLIIAGKLGSDAVGERANAVSMIERITGRTIVDIIRTGTARHVMGAERARIAAHLSSASGDDMVLAVGRELAAIRVSWADIVSGCSGGQAKQESPSGGPRDVFGDIFDNVFNGVMREAAERMYAHYDKEQAERGESLADHIYAQHRQAHGEYQHRQSAPLRSRSELPVMAGGVPRVERSGTSRNRVVYAIVSFRRMETNGESFRHVGEFIAFGQAWVDEIVRAERGEDHIFVKFVDPGDPDKMVQIRRAE